MTSPPGWHPDPVPPQAGQPPQLRYWDGARWTEHVAPAQQPVPAYQAYPAYPAHQAYPATPDGVPLAGWWWRALALVIDGLVLGVIAGIIAFPWAREVYDSYRDFFDEALDGDSGSVDSSELQGDLAVPLAIITLINIAVGFVYNVGFLMWKQATPGKLVLGLRVRLRERPGPMTIGTVLARWAGQYGVGLLGLVPVAGCLTFVYTVLDYLWPLWDDNNQAVHDKIAKTNVVRIR